MATSFSWPWAATLAALLAMAGCGDRDEPVAEASGEVPDSLRYGGTAVVASANDLQPMNALTLADYHTGLVQQNVLFTPLIRYDAEMEPAPWLAEKWDTVRVAPDTLELTFRLRRDVRWHDGEPTTARDVLFTYERAKEPRTAFPNAAALDLYHDAELVDPYTIRFRLTPHSDFLDIWSQLPPMPEHHLREVTPEQLASHAFGTDPVGNGPFRFVRYAPGQEWVFEANPGFPDSLGGRPYLDRLVYRVIPEQTTLLTELLTGGIDVDFFVKPDQIPQIRAAPDVELVSFPHRQWNYIGWNTRLPMFDSPEERRALTMAIDRESIVQATRAGLAEVGRATVTPGHWAFADDDPATLLPHDTAAARRLLASQGWIDRDGDGVLEDPEGREFRFTLKTNLGNDERKEIAEIVQAQLRPLGIAVQPQLVEWNTLNEQLQGRTGKRDFEAVISSWIDTYRKDDSDILHSRNVDAPFQYVGYSNPVADRLMDTLAVTIDRGRAAPLWAQYQRLLAEDAPYTVMYYPHRLIGVRNRLQGVEMDTRGELVTVADWWIHPTGRRSSSRPAQ